MKCRLEQQLKMLREMHRNYTDRTNVNALQAGSESAVSARVKSSHLPAIRVDNAPAQVGLQTRQAPEPCPACGCQFHYSISTSSTMSQQRPRSGHIRRNPSVDIPKYAPNIQMDADEQAAHEKQRTLHQISDYDSENITYHSDLPPKTPPPRRTVEELNLKVIQRQHVEVTRILSVAPYSVIYEFETIPEPKWDKKEIEGSLFICELTPGPYGEDRYCAIVLNRRSLKNFVAPLIEQENGGVEVNNPYVIMTFIEEGVQRIYGVFIFSEGPNTSTEHSRTLNGDLMVKLASQAGLSKKAAEASAAEAQAQHRDHHLQQAKQILQESEPASQGQVPDQPQAGTYQQLIDRHRIEEAAMRHRLPTYNNSEHPVDLTPGGSPLLPSPPQPSQQAKNLMALFQHAVPLQISPTPVQPSGQRGRPAQSNGGSQRSGQRPAPQQQQNNVLADLFARSGLPSQQPSTALDSAHRCS